MISERLAWAGEQRESLACSRTAVGRLPCCAGVSWLSRMLRAGNTVILSVPSVLADNQAISGWVIRCGTLNLHKCSQIGSRTLFKMLLLEYVSKCGIDEHFKNIFNYKQDHQRWRCHRRLLDNQSQYFHLKSISDQVYTLM